MSLVPPTAANAPCQPLLDLLRRSIARLEGGRKNRQAGFVSTGLPDLDQLLPQRGFRRGSLVEWLAECEGSGTAELALIAAREACREGGSLVVFDAQREFYPPAAARAGIDMAQLIVVQPTSPDDLRWALDQTLRSTAVAATLVRLERLDDGDFRRLQLAAEEGGGLGFFLRPGAAQSSPSWAEVRLLAAPLPTLDPLAGRRRRVTLLRCRGGGQASCVELRVDDETHFVPQAFSDATVADRRPAARA